MGTRLTSPSKSTSARSPAIFLSSSSAGPKLTSTATEDEERPCVICLSPISEEAHALPCNHAFDYICILTWLPQKRSCPLCKAAVRAVSIYDSKLRRHITSQIDQLVPPPPPSSSNATANARAPFRRRSRPRRPPPAPVTPDVTLLRRRHVYRAGLRSLHVGANRISRFRTFGPAQVRNDPELQSRARAFIRRELLVFEWAADNTEFLLEYIVAILKSVDLKSSSGAAEDMLADFLGRQNAGIFCHELGAWLRSPYQELKRWDEHVQYAEPLPKEFDEMGLPVVTGRRRRREEGVEERENRRRRTG